MSANRPIYQLTLPSKGLLYDGKLPQGIVDYTPLTAIEERLLSGNGRGGSVIDAILKNCLPKFPMPVAELLASDRFFILMILRAVSYGPEYKFDIKCPECAQKWKATVDLNDEETFPVTMLEDDAKEPFEITLPVCKKVVGFRLLRGADETSLKKYADQQYAKGNVQGDPTYSYGVARRILTIDGEDVTNDLLNTLEFVEHLIGRDSMTLRSALEKADCGIKVLLNVDCPKCGETFEQSLPLTAEFFRPKY